MFNVFFQMTTSEGILTVEYDTIAEAKAAIKTLKEEGAIYVSDVHLA